MALSTQNCIDVDQAFPDADPHEQLLFKTAFISWLAEIERLPRQNRKRLGRHKVHTEYEIDLINAPVIEVNDERFVRRFSVDSRSGEVRFVLSDPIRAVDPSRDPTFDDHVTVLYPNGKPLGFRESLPECILNRSAFLVPRRHREALVGDLLEDVSEMRRGGYGERFISFVVIWHIGIAALRRCGPTVRRIVMMVCINRSLRRWLAE
jgi:hypothetical protein